MTYEPHVLREAWRPNPGGQASFMAAKAKVVAALAGYGGGKTEAGARKALRLAVLNEGRDGLIVAPTWGILRKVTLRKFFDKEAIDDGVCPAQWVDDVFEEQRYIRLTNGSRIYYGSADRPGSLEGTNLAWWWLDEGRLVRSASWKTLIGRLRDKQARQLQAIVTSTPSAGWLQDEFGAEKPDRAVFHFSTRENEANLPEGFIEDLERTYSAREARVLIEGEFGLLVGAVLEEFERKTHLLDWKYDARLRTVAMWDPGFRRPYWGWAQQVPPGWPLPNGLRAPAGGVWVILDEIVDENLPTDVLAAKVLEKGYPFTECYCDPAAEAANPDTGLPVLQSMRTALAQRGRSVAFRYQTDPKWRHIPTGISILRGMLRNARNEIRLYVAKSLDDPRKKRGAVKDFEGYAYPEAKDGHPVGDTPLKDGLHDHGCDGIRYFAVAQHIAAGGPAATTSRAR